MAIFMKKSFKALFLVFICIQLTSCSYLIRPEKTFDDASPGDFLYGNRDGQMMKLNDSFVIFDSYGEDDDCINRVKDDDLWYIGYYEGPSQRVYYNNDFIVIQTSENVCVINCLRRKKDAISMYKSLDDVDIDLSSYYSMETQD